MNHRRALEYDQSSINQSIIQMVNCSDDPYYGPPPNFDPNPCETGIGGSHFVSGVCHEVRYEGNGSAMRMEVISPETFEWVCSSIGDSSDEWIPLPPPLGYDSYTYDVNPVTDALSCDSDSCNHYQLHYYDPSFTRSCCNDPNYDRVCCATPGVRLPCVRQSYKGNPLRCCFNDMDGTTLQNCWNGPGQRGTCHPCQRDITADSAQVVDVTNYNQYGQSINTVVTPCTSLTSQLNTFNGFNNCRDIAMSYCTGGDLAPDDPSWIYRWMDEAGNPLPYDKNNPSCYYALLRNLGEGTQIQNTTPTTCIPRPLDNVPPGGLTWSQRLMNVVFAKYTRLGFQLPAPTGSPGYSTFQQFLHNYVGCPYPIVIQQGLQATCSSQTMESISLNPALVDWCGCYLPEEEYAKYIDTYRINKSCVPACNSSSAIKLVSANNTYVPCTQGVCIIDDVTINIINSSGGDIGLNQVCNCQDCTCVVDNTSITVVNSEFGDININNKCGTIQCTNANGQLVDCMDLPVVRNWWWLYIIIALVIIIVFISLCLYLITRK